MLLHYLNLIEGLQNPLEIKLNLKKIGFYNYNHNFDLIKFENEIIMRNFKDFITHPLIHWNLELVYSKTSFTLDLINNITNHPTRKFGYLTIDGIHIINDPMMICKHNDFLKNYTLYRSQQNFNLHTNICLSTECQEQLVNLLKIGKSKNGFYLQNYISSNVEIIKIPRLFKRF